MPRTSHVEEKKKEIVVKNRKQQGGAAAAAGRDVRTVTFKSLKRQILRRANV